MDYYDDEPDDSSQVNDDDVWDVDIAPVATQKPTLPALLSEVGLGTVSTDDNVNLSYKGGILKASVRRPDGVTQTSMRSVTSGFRSMTEFNPDDMKNKEERNKHIRMLYRRGATQQDLADQFGLSQSMINRIVNE
ncbi:helix-turn-helix domain-containing protein [Burkholderia gladioli]|uniref:helix-turn-helix domain-containing protein n=1 Tax=Burkholderia gladioli TaxID=28095 RepID=UPI001640C537|nr:helix-turn-helix transcriptional regulator [Burkholderia gladioli]